MSNSARLFAGLAALTLLAACSDVTGASQGESPSGQPTTASPEDTSTSAPAEDPTDEATEAPSEDPAPAPEPIGELTIVSGGDILLHPSVWESARTATGFDFTPQYAHIKDYIAGADLALCSLEAPIAPAGEAYTGYPLFGSPAELIGSLKEVGWDGCNLATNHTMDRGFAGAARTADLLEEHKMGFAGAARTDDEFNQVQFYTLTVDDQKIDIAHISATTLTNGLVAPADKPWSWFVVGDLGPYDVSDIIDQARHAREQGADIVVVSMHWGIEYVNEPIEEQHQIADELAASGLIDLVYGNHAHVPQPIEKLDGGPNDNGMWTAWTMGNLISGQTIANHGYRVTTGYLATATVEAMSDGSASVTGLDWTVITQDAPAGNILYPLTANIENNQTTRSTAELVERGAVTYPVMEEGGQAERLNPPTPNHTYLEISRR